MAQDLLDIYPRKVYFFPHSGKVMVRKLRHMSNDTIIKREQLYSSRIKVSEVQGEIELFDVTK